MSTKISFVTNICTHYTVGIFEKLSKKYDIDFIFYSDENEWYWQHKHGKTEGDFTYKYLPGFRLKNTKVTLSLPFELIKKNYDLYIKCINGKFALPITFLISRLRRKPFILWTGIWMRLNTPLHRFIFPLTRFIYQHSDAIVVYGQHVKNYLISEGITEQKIFVAKHSVNNNFYSKTVSEDEIFEIRQKLGINRNDKVVLFLGRLEKNKGVDNLLLAFSKLIKNSTFEGKLFLVIAGEGSEKRSLSEICENLEISSSVRFCGYVPITEAVKFYAASTIFVLPSITTDRIKETWGLVINEAMNQSVPVIASDSVGAGAGGLIENGINGFIYPESDIDKLFECLKYLLENDDKRKEMGKKGKEKVALWNYDEMCIGFVDAIEYALRKKKYD